MRRLAVLVLLLAGLVAPGLSPASASPPVVPVTRCAGLRATIVGSNGPEVLVGTPDADVVAAFGGDDVIEGRGGADVICAGPGDDMVFGGSGADVLLGGAGDDILRGAAGGDTLVGGSGADLLQGDGGPDTAFGGDGDDVLKGGSRADLLLGGPGDDVLRGSHGTDTMSFLFADEGVSVDLLAGTATGEGSDTVSGVEHVVGSPFDDTLAGGDGPDRLEGGDGSDILSGRDGDDRLLGGPGDDLLVGGAGSDRAWFLAARGPVTADLATGTATGEGIDVLVGIENLSGSGFADHLAGDEGPNGLYGYFGDDLLEGRGEDDNLDGGWNGDSTLDGGPGNDQCTRGRAIDCETIVVIDPAYLSWIDRPRHGAVRDDLSRIAGVASTALGKPVTGTEVALRQITPEGCRWWDGDRSRPVTGPCERPIWNKARWGDGRFRLRIDGELPEGHYQARSRVIQGRARERGSTEGENLVEFRLT